MLMPSCWKQSAQEPMTCKSFLQQICSHATTLQITKNLCEKTKVYQKAKNLGVGIYKCLKRSGTDSMPCLSVRCFLATRNPADILVAGSAVHSFWTFTLNAWTIVVNAKCCS